MRILFDEFQQLVLSLISGPAFNIVLGGGITLIGQLVMTALQEKIRKEGELWKLRMQALRELHILNNGFYEHGRLRPDFEFYDVCKAVALSHEVYRDRIKAFLDVWEYILPSVCKQNLKKAYSSLRDIDAENYHRCLAGQGDVDLEEEPSNTAYTRTSDSFELIERALVFLSETQGLSKS